MRYLTLSELLDEFRGEAGISLNVAHGVTMVTPHKALLRRIQEELYLAYHWPHLATNATVDVAPGERYHEYPDAFVFEGITGAAQKSEGSNSWRTLGYGIGPDQLNRVDSDAGETRTPIERWQNYLSPAAENLNTNMFEVWPVPDAPATVRFTGRRKLFPLIADGDRTTIDGPLIALHAAAEVLARGKAEDAALKLQKAVERRHLLGLRQSAPDTRRANMAGRSSNATGLRRGIDYIE